MSGESPEKVERKQAIQDRAAEWLFTQGTSTVLLIAILGYGGYAMQTEIPKHIDSLNAGRKAEIKELTESHYREIERIAKSFDADQQRDEDRFRELMNGRRVGGLNLNQPLLNAATPEEE